MGDTNLSDATETILQGEWVSSFLTAHQHIIGYISALQWCEYCDKNNFTGWYM